MNGTLLLNDSTSTISSYSNATRSYTVQPEPDIPSYVVVILIIIGTIGNILVCLTIFIDKKLQNITNFFLVSLAVTDLLINLIILPARIAIYIYVLGSSSFIWCPLYLIGDDYLTAASALHICIISIERYIAIKNPLDMRNVRKRRIYIKISLVWFISLIFIIPHVTLAIINQRPNIPLYCSNILAFWKLFDIILYVEALIILVMVAVVFFSFIGTSIILHKLVKKQSSSGKGSGIGMVRTVGKNKSEKGVKNQGNQLQELSTEKKAMRVVWLVSFTFIIVMAPYPIVNMIYLNFPSYPIHPFVVKLASYLNYSNSVINPILYTIFNKQFRKNFKNIILFKYKTS